MDLILASASPRRRELLALITPTFSVETSDVDEAAVLRGGAAGAAKPTPAQAARMLAEAKCAAVACLHPEALVLGCDTVVDVDGSIFGKPRGTEDARRMLQTLRGRTHLVHTGVALESSARRESFAVTTAVTFTAFSDAALEAYLATPDPYDKAGGYGAQSGAAKFVRGIDGCFFNVMGLPVSRVYEALRAFGFVG